MFRTMTARYAGTCKRCRQDFAAGTRIRYGGRGRTYHLSAECPAGRNRAAEDSAEYAPERHSARPSPLESSADAAAEWSVDAAMAEDSGYSHGVHWSDPRADFEF